MYESMHKYLQKLFYSLNLPINDKKTDRHTLVIEQLRYYKKTNYYIIGRKRSIYDFYFMIFP